MKRKVIKKLVGLVLSATLVVGGIVNASASTTYRDDWYLSRITPTTGVGTDTVSMKYLKNFLDIDEEADELEINNVSIRYWEESSPYEDKAYVQPVYEVTGKQYKNGKDKGEFRIITQAIKNS